jgi:hypothetical protein
MNFSYDILDFDALKMETACFSETLVSTYESVMCAPTAGPSV